jgi:conjugal transfer pilin signal peptidase TrbI
MSTKALSHRDSISQQRLWNFIWGLPYILGVVVVGHVLTQRYSIGMDDQKELCLAGHHRWYLIDHWNREFQDGDLMAFESDERMRPFFKAETTFVKRVEGISGERVQEDQDQIRVNDRSVGHGFPLLGHVGVSNAVGQEPFQLQPLTYWVMGDHPKSFDSRYWGVVYQQQVIGRAYALPF